MELNAKFQKLCTLLEGQSPRGAWKKQEMIVETLDNYPKQICVTLWNGQCDEAAAFYAGQLLSMAISIESREFNGKWYNDVKLIRFNGAKTPSQAVMQQQQQQQAAQQPNPYMAQQQPPLPPVNEQYLNGNTSTTGDLPF